MPIGIGPFWINSLVDIFLGFFFFNPIHEPCAGIAKKQPAESPDQELSQQALFNEFPVPVVDEIQDGDKLQPQMSPKSQGILW